MGRDWREYCSTPLVGKFRQSFRPAHYFRDAGIGLVSYLGDICNTKRRMVPSPVLEHVLFKQLESKRRLNVLELGSGCGIVGIAFAQLSNQCNMLLTDLPQAMEILGLNISAAIEGLGPNIRLDKLPLDWESQLPPQIKDTKYDLVLVSDCTYNSDSLPVLVQTLDGILLQSPGTLIIVSMKVRHSSEAVFFQLMSDAGLVSVEHAALTLPDDVRSQNGQELEHVDIYSFYRRNNIPSFVNGEWHRTKIKSEEEVGPRPQGTGAKIQP